MRSLSDYTARELRPLLEEERTHWGEELLWDYSDVSAAVANGLDRGSLVGSVFTDRSGPVAYCYYMLDGRRAIVGSLFAREGFRGQGLEEELLESVLVKALAEPGNDRVECQTLFSTSRTADERFARVGFESRPRHYLVRTSGGPVPVLPHGFVLRPLRRDDLALAADIIHGSHRGTLDAALNLTYAAPSHCRSFVDTLVMRAGCGRFDPEASCVAEARGSAVGVLLASHLSRTNGHVCQVSVLPDAQGRGLGTLLMTNALEAFRRQGLATASLSVTVGNQRAYRLYERLGFGLRRAFGAHAWLRPPARLELPA